MGKLDHLFEGLEPYKAVGSLRWTPIWAGVSAIPHPCYPPDPAVVRAIHEFDPNAVPVRVIRAYRAVTGEVRVYSRHAVGSALWNPRNKPHPWTHSVMKPTAGKPARVTTMNMHLEERHLRKGDGLPGPMMNFDWRVYKLLRSMYQTWTEKEVQKYVENNDRVAKGLAKVQKAEEHVAQRFRTSGQNFRETVSRIDKNDVEQAIAKLLYRKAAPMIQVP